MTQERQKLKAKDFVTIGLLALLSIVLMYGVPMIFIFNYYIMVIAAPLLRALILGTVYFLLGVKVPKRWAFLIFSTIFGISGIAIYFIVLMIAAGLLAELILSRTGYGKFKGLTGSYMIFAVMSTFAGSVVPFLFFARQNLQMIEMQYGAEMAQKAQIAQAPLFMAGLLAATAVCAVVGALIGKGILKKHFKAETVQA